jgi:hypothetical protein
MCRSRCSLENLQTKFGVSEYCVSKMETRSGGLDRIRLIFVTEFLMGVIICNRDATVRKGSVSYT